MNILEDYRNLEKQWSLLQSAAPIGTPCYVIIKCSCGRSVNCKDAPHGNQKFLGIVETFYERHVGERVVTTRRCLKLVRRRFNITHIGLVGKSVFFSQEEAEEALYRKNSLITRCNDNY